MLNARTHTVTSGAVADHEVAPYGELVKRYGLPAAAQLMLAEVPPGARVLDVGCAIGYLAEQLTTRGCTVIGFERHRPSAAAAEAHCEQVIVGDIEAEADRVRIEGSFDVVLLGDVLEHLVDPWDTLRFVGSVLSKSGVVVASIPNVASWPVRLALLRGSFDYANVGLMDRTHLRWFTRASARELARTAGFEVERERFSPIEVPPGRLRRALPRVTDVAVKTILRIWPELMAQQFILRLRPCG
ncbi:MAG: class I SAM-dependent methyltransferase [Thermoleophilaceae bacterium]